MMINRTGLRTGNVLAIATGLALVVLPAAAAVDAPDDATTAVGGTVVADGSITPAPAAEDAVSPAADAGTTQELAGPSELGSAPTSPTAAPAQTTAAPGPADETGSTEAQQVQRACDAPADPHYEPARGRDADACYDNNGNFRPGRSYPATHYTNDVECGKENVIVSTILRQHVAGSAGPDGGYVGLCDDGFVPTQGRVTARADADGRVEVVADGDRDNLEETTQGWASATISPDGAEYRCGKSYDDGGRGTSDAPTSEDNAEQCNP